MDEIFKALSDPSRRRLLDLLKDEDGQNVSQLEAHFRDTTRFGVMKHLKVLEAANLVTSRKVGRSRLHYLNTVPLQEISERWISGFSANWSKGLLGLKRDLESPMAPKPAHIHTVLIKTSREALWQALTDPELTTRYFLDMKVESNWNENEVVSYLDSGGETIVTGNITSIVPLEKLSYTFRGFVNESGERDPQTHVSFEISEESPGLIRLYIVHDGFESEDSTYERVGGGWPTILSGLKTFLETGERLVG